MTDRYSGFLDGREGREFRGWAVVEGDRDEAAVVDVLIDGHVEAQIRADAYRADLCDNRHRGGYAAFVFEIPERFCDGNSHVIDARHAATGRSLDGSPKPFQTIDPLRDKLAWCRHTIILGDTIDESFAAKLAVSRKLAIFATYHPFSTHLLYHRQIVANLTAAGFTVVVVHASDAHHSGLANLALPGCYTVLKRNIGYDFGSYATAILCVADKIKLVDELVLMNDSILPIASDFLPLLKQFRTAGADVVACTDSYERRYHLQSYMMWFSAAVCRSDVLAQFMAGYSFTSVKEEVIEEGEIGLSRALQAEGFSLAPLYDYTSVAATWIANYADTAQRMLDLPGRSAGAASFKTRLLDRLDQVVDAVLSGQPTNPSHFFWDTLIDDFGFPFIKRELVIVNPCRVPTYFKIADCLVTKAEARDGFLEMRRKFGGDLVPSFAAMSPAEDRVRPLRRRLTVPQIVRETESSAVSAP